MTTKTFEYHAMSMGGAVNGRARAVSEQELDRALERQGLTLTRSREVASAGGKHGLKMKRDDLVTFTTQVATVLSAGVPLVQGMRDLATRVGSPKSRMVVEDLVRDLEAGSTLSDAMDSHRRSFPAVYRASVRAGELSGSMPEVLRRLASYLDWARSIRQTSTQAMIYPALLSLAIGVLVIVLITFVLPRIITMFPGGRDELPGQTRFLLTISDFIIGHWLLLLGGLAAAVTGFVMTRKNPKGRLALSGLALRIPRLGHLLKMLATSKYASTAAALHKAGCDIYAVMTLAAESCGSAKMEAAFKRATERVRQGQTIADALEKEPGMDPLLLQMVAVGEQSGDLGQSLEHVSEHYNKEVPRLVKWFMSFLEPTILVVAGVIVAFVLLAALLPVFDMYDKM